MSTTYHIRGVGDIHGFDLITDSIEVHFSMGTTGARLQKAFDDLKVNIMNSMLPFMPHVTGNFQTRTRAANTALIGTERMYAAVGPMGRYLYHGKVMVDAETGKGPMVIPGVGPRFRKGAKLKVTSRNLDTSSSNWSPFWFDAAKARDLNTWVSQAQKTAEGRR